MKARLFSLALTFVFLLSLLSTGEVKTTASAETLNENGFEYSIRNGKAAIEAYKGSAAILVIPNKLGNYPVAEIKAGAFWDCSSLESITIPETITSIGNYLFRDCNSLTTLNYNAVNCTFASSGDDVCTPFANQNIMHLNIGSTVKNIPDNAFTGLSSIKNLTIPNSVTKIGVRAFYGCESLETVTINNGITHIGEEAFFKCIDLKSINIPKSVTTIGYEAIPSVTNIYITDIKAWCTIKREYLINAQNVYLNNSLVTDLVIPYGVTEIAPYAFGNFSSVKSVVIPDTVTKIGDAAFYGCSALNRIEIPNSVTYIGGGAFGECNSLKSIKLPNNLTAINNNTFFNCANLKNIEIPKSLSDIKAYAFYGCKALKNVYFTGTKLNWNSIAISDYQNQLLLNATIHHGKAMPISIAKAKVSGIKDKAYTGKALKQSIKLKLGNKTLSSEKDYTVSYKNNKKIGTATVTLRGKGKYSGSIKKTFTIKPKTAALKSFKSPKKKQAKVTWKKDSKVTGYQIVYAINSKFTKGKKTVTVKSYKTTSKTIKSLKSKKTYYVKVRSYKTVKGKKIYSAYSKVKKVKIK